MFCPKCGKELPDNAVFCGNCGNRLAARVPAAAASQTGVPTYGTVPTSTVQIFAGDNTITQLVPFISSALMILLLFLPWIKIPLLESGLLSNAASWVGAGALSIKSSFPLAVARA